jgi:uncharacterized protein YkwD
MSRDALTHVWRPLLLVLASTSFYFLLLSGQRSAGQELKEFDADYLHSPAREPELDPTASAIIRRTNELRKEQGRVPLKTNSKLTRAAQYFASYIARTNQFSHEADGNRPADRASLFGYDYCIVAENIGYQASSTGFTSEELSGAIFDGWKTSPRHLANILDPDLTEVGVAIGHDPQSRRYYAVQKFGRPQSAAIRFEVTNNTSETLRYAIVGSGQGKADPQSFDLPPRTTMHHARCRPAKLDWGWTESGDNVNAGNGRVYVITKSARGYDVAAQTASE